MNKLPRCKTCTSNIIGFCENKHLHDENGFSYYNQSRCPFDNHDGCLTYQYCYGDDDEKGSFKVGPEFGCVHWKEKET